MDRSTIGRLSNAAGADRVAVLCAVTGLRGVGKTQVAAAYARSRVAAGWGLVGWVNAESLDSLLTGLALVAEAVGVADPEGDSARSAQRLRNHLETRTDSGLLVFDNATDPDVLLPLLPATGGTQLVLTSTDRAFADWGVLVDVSVFTRAESVGYLAERTSLDDTAGARAVAAELGDLPLALAQAAAAIKRLRWTFGKYLTELGRVPVEKLLGRVRGGDYPLPATAAMLLSVQAAEDADSSGLASLLLRVMAVLSPDGVHRDLLNGLGPDSENATDDVDAALSLCEAGSLLTWSEAGDVVIMHRLLARLLRERDQAVGRWRDTVEAALGLVDLLLFGEDEAWSRRAKGAELAIQVEALWDASNAPGSVDQELTERLLRARWWAVGQLSAAADLTLAVDSASRVLADSVRVLGPDHPDTLTSRNNLAGAYEAAGRLGEAIPLFEQNLAASTRVLGKDHPDTLAWRNNLAAAYESAGRPGDAIFLFEHNLAARIRVLGEDHPGTLTARGNLAMAYRSAGRVSDAIPLFEQNLADYVRILGEDHPGSRTSRIVLASAYDLAGRPGEAIPLVAHRLAYDIKVLGEDHPNTLVWRNYLANAFRSAGRLAEAIPLYEQNLADCVKVLGEDHPSTVIARSNLASASRAAGRLGRRSLRLSWR